MPAKKKPVAKRPAKKPSRKPVAKKTAPPPTRRRSVVGMTPMDKAKEFAQFCKDWEWWSKISTDKDSGNITVTTKHDDGRYKETITVEWNGNRVARNGIVYTIEGQERSLIVHNLAAARHHIDGSKLLKRETKERRSRRPAAKLRVLEDGSIGRVDPDEQKEIIGAHIIDKWYDMVVYLEKTVRGKTKQKVLAKCGNISTQTIDGLTRVFRRDYPDALIATRESEGSVRSREEAAS